MPIRNPTTHAIPNDVKRANSTAASAGTMKSGIVVESSLNERRRENAHQPATTDASTVFASDSWFGDRPASIPAISFSEAARVARPNRVQR